MGIDLENTVVFGDHINDVGLFEAGGTRIAVRNAHERIRRLADHIIDSNELDGVAHYIRQQMEQSGWIPLYPLWEDNDDDTSRYTHYLELVLLSKLTLTSSAKAENALFLNRSLRRIRLVEVCRKASGMEKRPYSQILHSRQRWERSGKT